MPRDKGTYIIQKKDLKSIKWAEAAQALGLRMIVQSRPPMEASVFLLTRILRSGVPSGYIARYLNDYPSLLLTWARVLSEAILIATCRIFRIDLFWILHNVDRETRANHRALSRLRREMFARFAKRIFVMDPLLLPYARAHFPARAEKVEAISFGQVDAVPVGNRAAEDRASEFIRSHKGEAAEQGLECLVLLCAGAPEHSKYLHFDYLTGLIEAAKSLGIRIAAVVAGNFSSSQRCQSLLKVYGRSPEICLFPTHTLFSAEFLKKEVDFYWRGYSDWSVPYTVYEAVTLQKPILALRQGFLPEMVETTGIGTTVSPDFSDLNSALAGLKSVPRESYERFLTGRTWESLIQKLVSFG